MAIRNRRGSASDFVPTKLVGAEFAVVQSGDENTSDGKALYLAVTDGQAKRIPFADEVKDYDDRARAAADDAIEAKNLAQSARTASAADANAAAQAARAASTAAENAQSTVDGAIDDIDAAKDAAMEEARTEIQRKTAQIAAIKTEADEIAGRALQRAVSAENEAATATAATEALQRQVNVLNLESQNYVSGGYVENGVAYFTHGSDVLFEITGIGGGGGGGGDTTRAVLTVTNTTGWLSKTISEGSECVVSFTWSSIEDDLATGDGTLRISVNGAYRSAQNIQQGSVSVDLGQYVASGSNIVRVQVMDIYGQSRSINFSITVISLSISSTFDTSTPYTGVIDFSYVPVGAVSKTVYIELDGQVIGTQTTTVSGRQMTYTIPAQSHGGHTLRAWFTAVINEETVRSNELYFEFISLEDMNDDPVIVSPYSKTEETQYASIVIPYTVYTPNQLTSEVTISVNNAVVSHQTVDRTQQSYTYRADQAGTLKITIASGRITKTFTLTITEVEIDIEAETRNLALYLSSRGRSNNEAHPEVWTYNDIAASMTGFNWKSDGWLADADGITVCRVSGAARVTIPYLLFGTDFRSTGKTIEIEFATRNVLDYDATVISCMSGGRGLSVTAQRAMLKSEQSEISTQYKEDEHVRIAFVCEKRAENRLLLIYINGVASGVIQYPTDDDFSQVEPVGITIGSSFCTTDIYCIRVYDNDLTRFQVLENWIADTQNGGELLDRYTRNNIFDASGSVVISKLPQDLPYFTQTAAQLPQYKGDKKTVSGSYVDPAHPAKSFTYSGAQSDVQGTSSQYYPRKNYKIKFKKGIILPSGASAETYAMNTNAIPTDAFTFKADVASSEGANNVELARLYNDACPYKTPAQEANAKVRQGIDGFPIVMFWDDGEKTQFLGKYNFNNDKGTEEVFGFGSGDESWEILNNTSDRVLWKSNDYESTIVDEKGKTVPAWLSDFEARYPDTDPAYTDPAQLKEFSTWLMTTDRSTATGDALPEPVTYGTGDDAVTYTNDTAEYRLAKFRAEAGSYMEMQSALFYYLFTELFLMVDSRAKNAFPSFIGGPVNE